MKRPKKRRDKPASTSRPAAARTSFKNSLAAAYGAFWRESTARPSPTTLAEDVDFIEFCRELGVDPVRMDELARASWRESRRHR